MHAASEDREAFMADAYTVPAELGSAIGDVDAVKTAFHNIDTDGSGSIDATEVASLFADIGKPVSPPDLGKLMRDADVDGSGTVSFEEFCAVRAFFVLWESKVMLVIADCLEE